MLTISVVIPVYNSEKYIESAVQSILNQTYKNFELIIINDGSTDNSLKKIRKFNDSRIVVLENEKNSGIVYSLNKGFERAKGEFIARMDADDIALPNRLKIQFEYMQSNPHVDILGSNIETFGSSSNQSQLKLEDEEIRLGLFFKNQLCHPTIMLRKKSLSDKGLIYNPDFFIIQDWVMWFDSSINGLTLANIPQILLNYRLEGQNITTNNFDTEKIRHFLAYKHFLPVIFQNINNYTLELHWAFSRADLSLVTANELTEYAEKLKIALLLFGFKKSLINTYIKEKQNAIAYKIIDNSFKSGINYCISNNILNFNLVKYSISKLIKPK